MERFNIKKVGFKNLGMFLFLIGTLTISCSDSKKGSGGMFASLLSSFGIVTDQGGSLPQGVSGSVYSPLDTPASLPANFGANGPSAILFVSSFQGVNRYKSLEIRFSKSMSQAAVQSDFSLVDSLNNPLPGPGKGGVFHWASGTRLIFDPYRELAPNMTYTFTLTVNSLTSSGLALIPYQVQFTTEPDYFINTAATIGAYSNVALGWGNTSGKDITFPTNAHLYVTSNFANPISGANPIQSITLNHMGSTDQYTICTGTCSMSSPVASNLDLIADARLSSTPGLYAFIGGNSYYYQITTATGEIFNRYFSFNYGPINPNPYGLLTGVSTTVMDQAQSMALFGQILQKFAHADFKVANQSFNDFASTPSTNSTATLSSRCINYYLGSITYIRNYGDNSGQYGDGYCGGDPNGGAFNVVASVLGLGNLPMYLDVFIPGISIPPTAPDGTTNITDSFYVLGNGSIGIDIYGEYSVIDLAVIGLTHDCTVLACLIGNGQDFYFTTNSTVNGSGPYTPRLARAKATTWFDSSGNINVQINRYTSSNKSPNGVYPLDPNDPITGNFYVSPWWQNLNTASMSLQASTSGLGSFLGPITNMIATNAVPQVTPAITQSLLLDIVERVSVNALNAVLQSLNNPGLELDLPNYLPAPLANFPLVLSLQVSSDAAVQQSGSNKGIVASANIALVAKPSSRLLSSNPNYHGQYAATGFVSTAPTGAAGVTAIQNAKTYLFSQSNATPGLLLGLSADTVTQAAYSLWQNGAFNLALNAAFINQIQTYAGNGALFQLTKTLLQASAIINILAPGFPSLTGLNPSNSSQTITVNGNDGVEIDLWAIHAPNGSLKQVPSGSAIPQLEVNFTDLELRIYGVPASGPKYLINTARASFKALGTIKFTPFIQPSGITGYSNLNALSLIIDPSTMSYTLDILEGTQYNPFGIDPQGVLTVVSPLIPSLIIPLVNNILGQIPLPSKASLATLTNPSNATQVCNLNTTTDKIKLLTQPIPSTQTYPFLFAGLQFQGAYAANPGNTISCP
ncbi:Ig-like protein [Leptospira broomii serovar Hurstbridge str. 5399]|uniref:Ig-like protein n=1 Tax=Leptospira broomii serovar Hurstbridge str. 5399 TaxID=1049789 RepID=T0FCN2_9LEPT|nr:Ig-like domain-containing protein [Leptospira broomii]EQA45362.1 Ig-like protein [Leptospira broomii serovar Hurstbridge str. 5399]